MRQSEKPNLGDGILIVMVIIEGTIWSRIHTALDQTTILSLDHGLVLFLCLYLLSPAELLSVLSYQLPQRTEFLQRKVNVLFLLSHTCSSLPYTSK